jgi:hypothetical protein
MDTIASAMTMTGTPTIPQITTGADGVPYTVIDSLPEPEAWLETPKTYEEGAIVKYQGQFWVALNGIIPGAIPISGGGDWLELDWVLAKSFGKVAAKITIQNCGTVPIYVSEGRSKPIIDAYHFALPACTVADDGTGGFTQWDDFRGGCIRIAGIGGAWRAAVKIIWRNTPTE